MSANPPALKGDVFEAILAHLQEGVIAVDEGGRVIWINPAAEAVLGLGNDRWRGRRACEVFQQPGLREIFSRGAPARSGRIDIQCEDGQVFALQIIPLPEGRFAVIFQEAACSTGVEQAKKDYADLIAHEMRSPLTAILGYAELIPLISPVTPRQAEFIRQIQTSVHNITKLIGGTGPESPSP